MKIFKLIILITFGLWAECKFDVPNEIDQQQLQNIINHGWNDKNATLNQLIIDYGNRVLPDILNVMEKPLVKIKASIDNPAPIPRLLLFKPQYMCLLAYTKYLEQINKTEQSIDLHLRALSGLHGINNYSVIKTIFRIVIESLIVSSFEQSIAAKKFTTLQIQMILPKLQQYLLQDKKIFLDTFQYEIKLSEVLFQNNLKYTKTSKERENLVETTEILSLLLTKYYQNVSNIKNSVDEKKFIELFEKERDNFLNKNEKEIAQYLLITWDYIGSQFVKNWKGGEGSSEENKIFIKSLIDVNTSEHKNINNQIGAKLFFYTSVSPKHTLKTKREIDELIARNLKLIKNFEKELE